MIWESKGFVWTGKLSFELIILYHFPIYFPFPISVGSASSLPLYNKLSVWTERRIINSISSVDLHLLYMVGWLELLRALKPIHSHIGFVATCVALVRAEMLWWGVFLHTIIYPAFAANQEFHTHPCLTLIILKCPFLTSSRCCDLHVTYTNDLCKRLEKAE